MIRQIAYVTQDNYLFDEGLLWKNIPDGKSAASDEEVIRIARHCSCYDFIMNLEDGFETQALAAVIYRWERQRCYRRHAQGCADSYWMKRLNPENEALDSVSHSSSDEGRTLIVIAHRLSTIMSADQIVTVSCGRIRLEDDMKLPT